MKRRFAACLLAIAMLCPMAHSALADDVDTAAQQDTQTEETADVAAQQDIQSEETADVAQSGADMDGLLEEMEQQGFTFSYADDASVGQIDAEAVVVDNTLKMSAGDVVEEGISEPIQMLHADEGEENADAAAYKAAGSSFTSYGAQLQTLVYQCSNGQTVRIGNFATALYNNLRNDVRKGSAGAVFQGNSNGIKALSVTVSLSGLSSAYYQEVARAAALIAYRSVDYDCSQMFYSNGSLRLGYAQRTGGVTTWIIPTYAPEMDTVSKRQTVYNQLEAKANEIVRSAAQYTRAYDKLKFFHDWLCQNNSYNDDAVSNMSNYSQSYGAPWSSVSGLLSKSNGYKGPVCEGYSRALQYLCDKVGITSAIVISDAHMWNSIRYGAYWSGMDVTWDDGSGSDYNHRYFLIPVHGQDSMHLVQGNGSDSVFGGIITYATESTIANSSVLPFYDSLPWQKEYVQYVYDKSYMNGVSCVDFAVNNNLTRAEFAMILYNMAGKPSVAYTAKFPDVPNGQWYTQACIWASGQKLIYGYDNGRFGPNDTITREQICAILHRKAGSPSGVDSSVMNQFADSGSISDFAKTAVIWSVNSGIIGGRTSGNGGARYVAPKEKAMRGEIAKIITTYQKAKA